MIIKHDRITAELEDWVNLNLLKGPQPSYIAFINRWCDTLLAAKMVGF